MEQQPLISIIVPVYNVAPYLDRCLSSLSAQTYRRLEIIAIDDASTDGGGECCDRWAEREPRLQVVHLPQNRGLSAARNEGVRRAAGAYLSFVDSDDWVEPSLIEGLYRCLRETGAEISICGTEGMKLREGDAGSLSPGEAAVCLARRGPFLWTAWGKLFPASLVRAHPFEEWALCCEDLLFFYQLLKDTRRLGFLPDRLYRYTSREGSLINSGIDEKRCTVLAVLDYICRDAAVSFPQGEAAFRQVAMDTAARLAMDAVAQGTAAGTLPEYLRRFRESLRRHFSWEALALCPERKGVAAELLLYAGTTTFWGSALLYQRVGKQRRRHGTGQHSHQEP